MNDLAGSADPFKDDSEKQDFTAFLIRRLPNMILWTVYADWKKQQNPPPPITADDLLDMIDQIKSGAIKQINKS